MAITAYVVKKNEKTMEVMAETESLQESVEFLDQWMKDHMEESESGTMKETEFLILFPVARAVLTPVADGKRQIEHRLELVEEL